MKINNYIYDSETQIAVFIYLFIIRSTLFFMDGQMRVFQVTFTKQMPHLTDVKLWNFVSGKKITIFVKCFGKFCCCFN